jgi:hypothetical protein
VRDFDSHFKSIQRQQKSIFRAAFVVWGVLVCAGLAGTIALVYVAAHFLSKFW